MLASASFVGYNPDVHTQCLVRRSSKKADTMGSERRPIVMEEVTDADELAHARRQRESFDRNAAWLQRHVPAVYARHRGKCICVAGEELFVAGTAREAIALARTAHPEDEGWFTRYVPEERAARIYAL